MIETQTHPQDEIIVSTRDPFRWRVLAAGCLLMVANLASPPLWVISGPSEPQPFGAAEITYRLATSLPTLVYTVFVLVGGALGDLFGRRRLLLTGVGLFLAGNLLSIIAPGAELFQIGRVLVAVGAALFAPLVMAFIRLIFDPDERIKAMGLFTGVVGLALIGGPIQASLMAGALGWRASFLLGLTAALIGGGLAWRFVRESRAEGGLGRADAFIMVGWSIVLLALVFGLSAYNAGRFAWGYALVGITVGLIGGLLLAWVEWYRPHPLRHRAIDRPAFAVVVLAGTLLYSVFLGAFIQLNSFFTLAQHYTHTGKMLALLPLAPAILIGGALVGRLSRGLAGRALISLSFLLLGAASVGLSLASPATGYIWLLGPILVLGAGFSLGMTHLTLAILSLAPRDLAGSAAAVGNAMGRVGSSVGLTITSVMLITFGVRDLVDRLTAAGLSPAEIRPAVESLSQVLQQTAAGGEAVDLPPAVAAVVAAYEASYTAGFGQTLQLMALFCLVGAALIWFGLRRPQPAEDNHSSAPE